MTIAADVEALYHELLEALPPAERAELARLLAEDGAVGGLLTPRTNFGN